MVPVTTALPGPSIYKELHDERLYSEQLGKVLERVVLDRRALELENEALRKQAALADGLRSDNELLRDFCSRHGLNAEAMLEDA